MEKATINVNIDRKVSRQWREPDTFQIQSYSIAATAVCEKVVHSFNSFYFHV